MKKYTDDVITGLIDKNGRLVNDGDIFYINLPYKRTRKFFMVRQIPNCDDYALYQIKKSGYNFSPGLSSVLSKRGTWVGNGYTDPDYIKQIRSI